MILAKFGIDINDAVNGVFLDKSFHAKLHTKEYYKMVERLLKEAKTKEEAIKILQQIAENLKSME
ncbi:TPA: hypothetical protein ENS27_12665 [bacterium]|nr:hypothetical protein [bacterium]